jgi:hypothetical protein
MLHADLESTMRYLRPAENEQTQSVINAFPLRTLDTFGTLLTEIRALRGGRGTTDYCRGSASEMRSISLSGSLL